MNTSKYSHYKDRLKSQTFPYAVLDLELFWQNVNHNIQRSGTKKIRIASKSIRSKYIMNMILENHHQFDGIMTYHGNEMAHLAQNGFDNLLMGYPIADAKIIENIAYAIQKGSYCCLMVDAIEHLQLIEKIGHKTNTIIPICIDLDLSDHYPGLHFGVWRSSITHLEALDELLTSLKNLKYIRLDGLMGYEAQIAGVGDAVKGGGLKNNVIQILKKRSINKLSKRRKEAVELIKSFGFELRFVNGGGTGSLETTITEDTVTEVTVGSGFYAPHLFDYYQNFDLQPALFYGIQIVRVPTTNTYTCHGGGFIASGGIEAIKAPIIHLPETGYLDTLEGAGEVQTPIRFKQKQNLQIGDPIYLRHAKAGELCERFNTLLLLEKTTIREITTYRGEGLSFG